MLEKEFQYYVSHQNELAEHHNGKFLVIIGENVISEFDSFEAALKDSVKKYEPGTFLIQQCLAEEDSFLRLRQLSGISD